MFNITLDTNKNVETVPSGWSVCAKRYMIKSISQASLWERRWSLGNDWLKMSWPSKNNGNFKKRLRTKVLFFLQTNQSWFCVSMSQKLTLLL